MATVNYAIYFSSSVDIRILWNIIHNKCIYKYQINQINNDTIIIIIILNALSASFVSITYINLPTFFLLFKLLFWYCFLLSIWSKIDPFRNDVNLRRRMEIKSINMKKDINKINKMNGLIDVEVVTRGRNVWYKWYFLNYNSRFHIDIWQIVFHTINILSPYTLSCTHISFVVKRNETDKNKRLIF